MEDMVSRDEFDRTVARLDQTIERLERRLSTLDDTTRSLGYDKADTRHDHRGQYAEDRHYH